MLTVLERLLSLFPRPGWLGQAHSFTDPFSRFLLSAGYTPDTGETVARSIGFLPLYSLQPGLSLLAGPPRPPSTLHWTYLSAGPIGPRPSGPIPPCTCCLICKTDQGTYRPCGLQSEGSSQLSAGGFAGIISIITIF